MLKRGLAAAMGWLALAGMQAPPPQAELALWRLDCGEFVIKQYGAFFSDTFQYPPGPKNIVGSCYLIRNGDRSTDAPTRATTRRSARGRHRVG